MTNLRERIDQKLIRKTELNPQITNYVRHMKGRDYNNQNVLTEITKMRIFI